MILSDTPLHSFLINQVKTLLIYQILKGAFLRSGHNACEMDCSIDELTFFLSNENRIRKLIFCVAYSAMLIDYSKSNIYLAP
jgi:hypothetical protein